MEQPSLSMQRQAMEHLLAILETKAKRTKLKDDRWLRMIETARHGCRTLAWFERRQELIRKVHALEQAEPLLAEIVRVFPDATLRDVPPC